MTSLLCKAVAAMVLLGVGLVAPSSAGAATSEDETPGLTTRRTLR